MAKNLNKTRIAAVLLALLLFMTGCADAVNNNASNSTDNTTDNSADNPADDIADNIDYNATQGDKNNKANATIIPIGPAPAAFESRPTRPITTTVTLADGNIQISGNGARADGSVLTITADGVYEIKGTLTDGQVIVDAPSAAKVELVLSGVDITSGKNSAIYCKNALELIVTLTENTENILTDASDYTYVDTANQEPNATLFSKCDMNIGGSGRLTVNANFNNGIHSKDALVIEGGKFDVTAADDAIRGKDSLTILDGIFNIEAGGDGLQASSIESAEFGWVLITGGEYNIKVNGDAVQAETALTVEDGTFDIITEGTPVGESDSQKGLKSGTLLTVESGTFRIVSKDDAVHADIDTRINGGIFHIETGDDGIHANRNLYINGGEINIPVCYEGFEGTIIEVNGGKSFIDASNDAVSAAAGTPEAEAGAERGGNPYVYAEFNGGELEAVSGGDTVDSNGNIYVKGGTLRLSSPPAPDYEGSLLCNGDVTISGGNIAVAGCMGVNVFCREQPVLWVSHVTKLPKGTVLSLRDENGNILLELTTLKDAVQSAYTSADLQAGGTYALYIDGEKKVEVTLKSGMNTTGDDGGEFTGGYHRGTW